MDIEGLHGVKDNIISTSKARGICSDNHNGQWSPFYQFASSGIYLPEKHDDYIAECDMNILDKERDGTKYEVKALKELKAYFEYKQREHKGLTGLSAPEIDKAQKLINEILITDNKSRGLINRRVVELEKLKKVPGAAAFVKQHEDAITKAAMELADRNEKIKRHADGKGFLVKTQQASGAVMDFTNKAVNSALNAVKSGAQSVSKAWNYLFGNDVKGLGAVPVLAVVAGVTVVSAAAGALIYKQFYGDWGKATQTLDNLSKTKSLCEEAVKAGIIKDCSEIQKEVNDALQREHEAGAKGQWWKSVGSIFKIGVPVLVGGYLVIDGIPRLMRYTKKQQAK